MCFSSICRRSNQMPSLWESYRRYSHLPGKRYFAKIGSSSEKDQYIGGAESLKSMGLAALGISPHVFASGCVDNSGNEASTGRPYFLSEYKELGSLTNKTADVLAKRLATEMHRYKSEKGFGFQVPTYCGATRQENGWYEGWEECYSGMIGGLLDKLKKKGGFVDLCSKGEIVRRKWVPATICQRTHVELICQQSYTSSPWLSED